MLLLTEKPRAALAESLASESNAALPIQGARARKAGSMLRKTGANGNLSGVPCPNCRCAGNYTGHGRYSRHLVLIGSSVLVEVRRVRCASCGVTHAVLPDGVVPYRAYSEEFVLAVLSAWASGLSNAQVRREFGISESTRRRILASARRRACALLSCGASRSSVGAALLAAGIGSVPGAHMDSFGTRFAENVRLSNLRRGRSCRFGPST